MSAFPNVWKDQTTKQQTTRGSYVENVGPATNDDRQTLTQLQFQ